MLDSGTGPPVFWPALFLLGSLYGCLTNHNTPHLTGDRAGKEVIWQRARAINGSSTSWTNRLISHESQQSKCKGMQLVWNNPIQHYSLRDVCVEDSFSEELWTSGVLWMTR